MDDYFDFTKIPFIGKKLCQDIYNAGYTNIESVLADGKKAFVKKLKPQNHVGNHEARIYTEIEKYYDKYKYI